jgi:hypothetical protein
VAERLKLQEDKLQLFRHKRELTAADEARTLAELDMHTGFSLMGWDLVRERPPRSCPTDQGQLLTRPLPPHSLPCSPFSPTLGMMWCPD